MQGGKHAHTIAGVGMGADRKSWCARAVAEGLNEGACRQCAVGTGTCCPGQAVQPTDCKRDQATIQA
jgi:hypothetical protein